MLGQVDCLKPEALLEKEAVVGIKVFVGPSFNCALVFEKVSAQKLTLSHVLLDVDEVNKPMSLKKR